MHEVGSASATRTCTVRVPCFAKNDNSILLEVEGNCKRSASEEEEEEYLRGSWVVAFD